MMDRLVQVAAEAMADRAGVSPDDPEPQIAAVALLGLWRIQYQAMGRYADGPGAFDEVNEDVIADVARAARLDRFGAVGIRGDGPGPGTRDQVKAAAEAAQNAGRQVASALRQARAWRRRGPNGAKRAAPMAASDGCSCAPTWRSTTMPSAPAFSALSRNGRPPSTSSNGSTATP